MEQPKDASHGRVLTDARECAKPAKDDSTIPDGCVAAVVREVLTKEGRTKEQLEVEASRKRETVARAEWDQLMGMERVWIIYSRATGKPPTIGRRLKIGDIGQFDDDVALKVRRVLSRSSFTADVEWSECTRASFRIDHPDRCDHPDKAIFSNIDTSAIVNDAILKPGGVYWVTGTTSGLTVSKGDGSVYAIERIVLDAEKLKPIVPPPGVLAKAPKQP